MIKFETHGIQPLFPYYMSLFIHVECLNNTIIRIVIDEVVVAFMMSLSCWKDLGSPMLSQSSNMLTAFNGRLFWLHSILPSLEVQLGGKIVAIEVGVVDAPLYYNLLLGWNWMYNMQAVASSLFWVVCFLFNGKIITIDQNSFQNPSVNTWLGTSILIINHSQPTTEYVGVGMYPYLMGNFICPVPILMIGSSLGGALTSLNSVSFRC